MNKKILRTLTALCAALVLMGGFSVTAFAQTPEGEDDTDDSGVVYEEPQKEEPLTPDGNATLVDDFGGNKQLKLLYAELYQTGDRKKCTECGTSFASSSNSVKYCPDCRKRITRRQAAERMRKRRAPVTQ